MKSKTKRSAPKLKLLPMHWIAWGVIGLVGSVVWWQMRVVTIICRVDAQPCPPATMAILAGVKHKQILFLDLIHQTDASLQAKTGYHIVSVQRQLPDTLKVQLAPQTPRIVLQGPTSGQSWFVSESGTVYEGIPNPELQLPNFECPPIVERQLLDQGTLPEDVSVFLLDTAAGFRDFGIESVKNVLTSNQELVIYLDNGQKALVDNQDPYSQLKRLKLLLQAQAQDQLPTDMKTLDVRYRLPVIRKD